MDNELQFAADLYRGTAGYYDSYRLPYPDAMIEYVVGQAMVDGQGRLLDLACGTGQLTFPLRRWFSEVWAVDREQDMVEAVRAKAAAIGAENIRPIAADAETLHAAPGHFELAVIGNAFHRLRRDQVAGRLLGWLKPGGCVALCWSHGPQAGDEEWQRAFRRRRHGSPGRGLRLRAGSQGCGRVRNQARFSASPAALARGRRTAASSKTGRRRRRTRRGAGTGIRAPRPDRSSAAPAG